MRTAVATRRRKPDPDAEYSGLLNSVSSAFAATKGRRLFVTDSENLFDLYLDNLPKNLRQHHTCHACQRFVQKYGALVVVQDDGKLRSALWNAALASEPYQASFAKMAATVERERISAPFYAKGIVWGTPVSGEWTHFSVIPPAESVWGGKLLTAGQKMAAHKESFKTVALALSEVKPNVLDEVLRLFESETLHGADKFIGPVKWLRSLQDRPKGRVGENLLWKAIAEAPEGYLHPRASLVWPLVEAVLAGEGFASVKAKYDAMTHPLRYQRPQAAPTVGNIKQAEDIVAKLGIAASLERRFARLEDIKGTLWIPKVVPEKYASGVFGHLKTKNEEDAVSPLHLPAQTVTWDKFVRTALPVADELQVNVTSTAPLTAFTTAADADAPPILKWDSEEDRYPVAWYTYHNGTLASQWGLSTGWNPVTAVVPFPKNYGHEGVLLAIKGCIDSRTGSGNALFPECLKHELFPIRATIEAFSSGKELQGRSEASVCGWDIRKGSNSVAHLRTLTLGRWTEYRIDRWD